MPFFWNTHLLIGSFHSCVMDDPLIPKLKKITREVIDKADGRGGPLEKGEFTMAIARHSISSLMGFKEDALDGKRWRTLVKVEIQKALVGASTIAM